MDINDLTLGQARELGRMMGAADGGTVSASHPFEIGKNYLLRTVTHINTGRIVSVGPQEIVLEDACWIADTGRWADNLVSCEFKEVEPYPDGAQVIVGRAALIDAVQIDTLPTEQK